MILLTHNDLDAVGCEICIRRVSKIDKVFYEDYITLKQTVQEIVEYAKKTKEQSIIIADLSFSENPHLLQYLLNRFKTVIHIDHHSYPEDFKVFPKSTFKQIIDPSRCACKICYDVFKLKDEYLGNLINVIDSFDRFVISSPLFTKGVEMNEYFWKYGYNHFFETFKDSYPRDYDNEVKIINETVSKSLEDSRKNGLILENGKTTIQFGVDYFIESQLQEYKRGQKGFLCVTPSTVKIRLNQDFFTEQEANELRLKIINSVKGHPYAFVAPAKKDKRELFEDLQRMCTIINEF